MSLLFCFDVLDNFLECTFVSILELMVGFFNLVICKELRNSDGITFNKDVYFLLPLVLELFGFYIVSLSSPAAVFTMISRNSSLG